MAKVAKSVSQKRSDSPGPISSDEFQLLGKLFKTANTKKDWEEVAIAVGGGLFDWDKTLTILQLHDLFLKELEFDFDKVMKRMDRHDSPKASKGGK